MSFHSLVTQSGPNILRLRLVCANDASTHFGKLAAAASESKHQKTRNVFLEPSDAAYGEFLPVAYYFRTFRCKGIKCKIPMGHCVAKPVRKQARSRLALMATPCDDRDRLLATHGYREFRLRHAHVAIALELMETFNRAAASAAAATTSATPFAADFDTSFFRRCLAATDDAAEAFFLRVLHGDSGAGADAACFADRAFVSGFRAQRDKLVAILAPQVVDEDESEDADKWFVLYLSTLEAHLVWGTLRHLASGGVIARPEQLVYMYDGFAAKIARGHTDAAVVAACDEQAARAGYTHLRWHARSK